MHAEVIKIVNLITCPNRIMTCLISFNVGITLEKLAHHYKVFNSEAGDAAVDDHTNNDFALSLS